MSRDTPASPFRCLETPHSDVLKLDTVARSTQDTQVRSGALSLPDSHQDAVPLRRARCVPDRVFAVPLRRADANTSPIAAAIASTIAAERPWRTASIRRGGVERRT